MAALLLLPSSSSRGAAAGEVEEEPAWLRAWAGAQAWESLGCQRERARTDEDGKCGNKNSMHAEVQHLLA